SGRCWACYWRSTGCAHWRRGPSDRCEGTGRTRLGHAWTRLGHCAQRSERHPMQILRRRANPPPWEVEQAASLAERFLRRCGRRALAPEALAALQAAGAALSSADWEEVGRVAQVHGMQSLLFKHTAQADLLSAPPPAVVATLKTAYCATLLGNRRFQR